MSCKEKMHLSAPADSKIPEQLVRPRNLSKISFFDCVRCILLTPSDSISG